MSRRDVSTLLRRRGRGLSGKSRGCSVRLLKKMPCCTAWACNAQLRRNVTALH